jgi:hemerythrin-like domain-containing protein
LPIFAQQLSAHIRKEERQLFERLQQLMSARELETVGIQLQAALKESSQACILPNEATRLRAKN